MQRRPFLKSGSAHPGATPAHTAGLQAREKHHRIFSLASDRVRARSAGARAACRCADSIAPLDGRPAVLGRSVSAPPILQPDRRSRLLRSSSPSPQGCAPISQQQRHDGDPATLSDVEQGTRHDTLCASKQMATPAFVIVSTVSRPMHEVRTRCGGADPQRSSSLRTRSPDGVFVGASRKSD